MKGKEKMRKNGISAATLLLSLALITSLIPMIALTEAADAGIPTGFQEYSNAYATAIISVPSIGNITQMTIAAIHQDKSFSINNYEVLALQLSSSLSPRPTDVASISITTNFNDGDINWRKALRNGTSQYTEVNGVVTINNLLRVTANELRVVKTGNRVTVDFEPKTPVVATLPSNVFPPTSFPTNWTIPAFHMDVDINGTSTFGNSTTVNPSGWSETNNYVSANANYTFSCPSWNNYRSSGSSGGSVRSFDVHKGEAPSGAVLPTPLLKIMELYTLAQGTFSLPKIGGITQMQVQILKRIKNTPTSLQPFDLVQITLTAAGFNGSVLAALNTAGSVQTNITRAINNGSSTYTEVNGNVIVNNIFDVSTSELNVQFNGTRCTVNFNPTTPINIMLPANVFPRTNFSATWALPAFTAEFNANATLPFLFLSSAVSFPSGWKQTNDFALWFAAGTLTAPTWNLTTTIAGTTTYYFPYMETAFSSPDLPKQPAATAFTTVAVLPGWTWYFFAHSNEGVAPYTYQWYEGTTLLQGQTSMVLPVTKTAPGTYTFYCKVVDAQGTTANSNAVTLTVMG
jgi:hypothetical protein